MIKVLIWILVLITTTLIALWALPWWGVIVPSLAMGYFSPKRPLVTFAMGFAGVFLLYFCVTYRMDVHNDGILTNRIGLLFNNIGSMSVLIISSAIGGLLSGFSAAFTASLKKTIHENIN